MKHAVLIVITVAISAAGSTSMSAPGRDANGLIAYTVLFRVPGERSSADYIYGLCVRNLGGVSRRVTAVRLRADESAAWSPDGRLLAFDRTDVRNGKSSIMVLDEQGQLRNLSEEATSDTQPTWSPDARSIAFVQKPGEIYVMSADGSGRRLLVPKTTQPAHTPRWSPDGRHIAFVRGIRNGSTPSDVMLVNADGSSERKLAEGTSPSWAPDGRTIVYEVSPDFFTPGIFAIGVDDGRRRRLTNGYAPVWSPDGRRILFSRERLRLNGETATDLFLVQADGARVRAFLRSPLWEFDAAWQPRPLGSRVFPLGSGPPCAVFGDEGSDSLRGSKYGDFVYGFGGRDLVRAGAGRDVVSGDEGADVLNGGPGNDRIGGGFDSDRILGGAGDDALFADGGEDVLLGGRGSDRLFGGTRRDRLDGGPGDDVLSAVDGARDSVSCGPGRDVARLDRHDRARPDCEEIERLRR